VTRIFVTARRSAPAAGPGTLVAAQRLTAGEFPLPFSLGADDVMIPGSPFEGPLTVTARVDKDGDPLTRRRGDLFGQALNVGVGAARLVVTLDSVQREDVTLAGSTQFDRTELPPGHP
jgi:hypothetical protein